MFSLDALPLGDATDQQVIKMLLEGMRAAKKNPCINLSVFESETERVPAWLCCSAQQYSMLTDRPLLSCGQKQT